MKLPTIKNISALVRLIKPNIRDEEDTVPGIDPTIGWDPGTGDWGWQTGDNSYTGGAYGYPIWAVTRVHRRTDSRATARDLRQQLEEQSWT